MEQAAMSNRRPIHQRLVRSLMAGGLLGFLVAACAGHHAIDRSPVPPPPFVSDVTDDEWQAALPAKELKIAQPRLLRGPSHPDEQGILRLGETAIATAEVVIRADGRVGVRRIVASTNPRYTENVIRALRSQVYEPPVRSGSPVAVRGELSFQATRTQ